MILRRVAAALARGKVLRRHIRAGYKVVPIFGSPDAQLQYFKLRREAFHRDLVDTAGEHPKPDCVVWDVGANVGVFTVADATVAYNWIAIAIEAGIWLARLVWQIARQSEHDGRFEVLLCSVGGTCRTGRLQSEGPGRTSDALASVGGNEVTSGRGRETHPVSKMTLDKFLDSLPRPDFVNIDVERAEILVLADDANILHVDRSKIYFQKKQRVVITLKNIMQYIVYSVLSISNIDINKLIYRNLLFISTRNI